ncbi:unnamed protein product [Linum trigynum]|uniref:Uncharacterized protein n=1 Tax=Linum trigynum TaxID=586398 RepID=A0AAV2G8I0_9ROSI
MGMKKEVAKLNSDKMDRLHKPHYVRERAELGSGLGPKLELKWVEQAPKYGSKTEMGSEPSLQGKWAKLRP